MNKYSLPYFQTKQSKKLNNLASSRFLRRKFLPLLRKKLPQHYLITQDPRQYLKFIQTTSKKYPYFLYFDIAKYFLSINHQILLCEIALAYSQLTAKPLSRRFKHLLKNDLPQFLKSSPYTDQGLPIGNSLSHILAGVYLLKLDLNLNLPFLRFTDDYFVFGKSKSQLEEILRKVITPILNELKLSININKLKSGKFHQDKVIFLGFEFYAGYIRIAEQKIQGFRQRIKGLTYLTRRKPVPAVIKLLNNQILGFGHYYKFADCQTVFKNLDVFVRFRLRRYILRNRNLWPKTANLFLTNQSLKELGLKSLTDIKTKFNQKFKRKKQKSKKIKQKIGYRKQKPSWKQSEEIADRYRQKQILFKLNELTGLIKKMKRQVAKIEKKLN